VNLKPIHRITDTHDGGWWSFSRLHLKDLKASDVQDAEEEGGLPLALVQRLVDPSQDPPEQPLVHRLGQRLNGKISLGVGAVAKGEGEGSNKGFTRDLD